MVTSLSVGANGPGTEERMANFVVKLSACGNPDFGQSPDIGVPAAEVECASIEVAQATCRAYIAQYNLGGGNWTGGQVSLYGVQCGRISYNGRYWPGE